MASLPTSTTNRSSKRWLMSTSPLLGLAARITLQKVTHPFITLPPITMRWLKAHFALKKGVNRFAFYGLPESSGKRWATEREYAFRQLVAEEKYRGVVYQG